MEITIAIPLLKPLDLKLLWLKDSFVGSDGKGQSHLSLKPKLLKTEKNLGLRKKRYLSTENCDKML